MTIATARTLEHEDEVVISPGTARSLGVSPYEATSAEPLTFWDLSTPAVYWTTHVNVPARNGRLEVQGTGVKPPWLEAVIESLANLLSLEPGWDSYDAGQITPEAVIDAIKLLLEIASEIDVEIPQLVPTTRGGVQLEWQRHGLLVEVEINPGSSPVVFVENGDQDEEYEGELTGSLAPLRSALASS